MLAKAPIVNYEVYLINQGYVCAGTNTFEQAMKIAKNTGFECNIYSITSSTPHQPVATTSAVQEATSMDIVLQIIGFIAIAYVLVKFFPAILSAVFKLSVIVIALVFVCIAVSVYMSDWTWSANYV